MVNAATRHGHTDLSALSTDPEGPVARAGAALGSLGYRILEGAEHRNREPSMDRRAWWAPGCLWVLRTNQKIREVSKYHREYHEHHGQPF